MLLDVPGFGIDTDVLGVASAMRLAEAVAAGDQRHRLFVVHRHALEGLADIASGRQRVRRAARPLRVHVNEPHLHGRERIFQVTLAGVALLVLQPDLLGAPVNVLIRLPDVGATAAKTKGLEAHRLERDVPGQNEQVGPRNVLAILLLDRPKQAPCLVEVHVVRPGAERRKALLTTPAAAAPIERAVRARAVPSHADE